VHKLVRTYLKKMKLTDWKCTRIIMKKQIFLEGQPSWATISVDRPEKKFFRLALSQGMDLAQLNRVVAHELGHIPTIMLDRAIRAGDKASLTRWEEYIANQFEAFCGL
jgi:hypothetical protein